MLAFGSALAAPLVIVFLGLIGHRIRREERALLEHFGDEYQRYRSRTGALLPALRRGT
jgi:protein-S-isoprenylcysteine O-methyltransferase Ste14